MTEGHMDVGAEKEDFGVLKKGLPQNGRRSAARVWRPFAGALAAALLLTGCGAGGSAAPSGPVTVTVGTLPLVSSAPVYLAEGLGYWKTLGLNVEIKKFTAAGAIDVAAAANSIDVSATGVTASLFNLWGSGKREYIVADKGRIWPGQQFEALLVSDSAWNSGVRSVAALKGQRFGNTAAGSTFDYLLGTILGQHGLSLKDVTDVPLTTLPNMLSAVESGQVAATILPQPFANLALQSGKVHRLLWVDHHVKADLLVIAYSPQFAKDQSAGVRFMQGYLQAVRYYDQYLYGKHPASPQQKRGLAIISRYTHASPATILESLVYIDPQAKVDARNIQKQFSFYKANGFVSGNVKVKDMIDPVFLRAAARKSS